MALGTFRTRVLKRQCATSTTRFVHDGDDDDDDDDEIGSKKKNEKDE